MRLMSELLFESMLWKWGGKGGWYSATVPEEISGIIRMCAAKKNGFGSVHVSASIGGHEWKTSLFADAKSGCYFLPAKAEIRRTCKMSTGDPINVRLNVFS